MAVVKLGDHRPHSADDPIVSDATIAPGSMQIDLAERRTLKEFCDVRDLDLVSRVELVLFVSGTVAAFQAIDIGFVHLKSDLVYIGCENGELLCDLDECEPMKLYGERDSAESADRLRFGLGRKRIVSTCNLIQVGNIFEEVVAPARRGLDELVAIALKATSLRAGFRYPTLANLNDALADWLRLNAVAQGNCANDRDFCGRWTWV